MRPLKETKGVTDRNILLFQGQQGLSQRARVQRGESATARCASTGNRQGSLPFSFFYSSFPVLEGVARWSLTARVERAPLHRARSASKKGCRAAPSRPCIPICTVKLYGVAASWQVSGRPVPRRRSGESSGPSWPDRCRMRSPLPSHHRGTRAPLSVLSCDLSSGHPL